MTKKEKALKYIDSFPEVPKKLEKQALEKLPAYILFDHQGRARCTACGKEHRIPDCGYTHSTGRKSKYYRWEPKSKHTAQCPHCGRNGITVDITKKFNGKTIEAEADVAIFIAGRDGNLYIRCFYQDIRFKQGLLEPIFHIQEMQRYVYAPEVSARYGADVYWQDTGYGYLVRAFDADRWIVRSKMDCPNFYSGYGIADIIGLKEAVKRTWLKYSMADRIDFIRYTNVYKYLEFYRTHQGIERLIKCGMETEAMKMAADRDIAKLVNWKETEVTKMLGVTKPVFNMIREKKIKFEDAVKAQSFFPKIPILKALDMYGKIGYADHLEEALKTVKTDKTALAKYIIKQGATSSIYRDYIITCKKLGYDLKDTLILYPPHLMAAHDRAISALEAAKAEERTKTIDSMCGKKYKELRRKRRLLEYESGDFVITQPGSVKEIIMEGKKLSHCVGGYAEQHANGQTNIMFLRRKSEPGVPFYTIEVSNDYELIQCHGYANEQECRGGKPKPKEITELEKEYQKHLENVKYTSKQPQRQKVRVSV